jgi:hypothetical protein
MKRFLIAAAAVTTIAAATASPAFAVQVWQGDMFLTDANAACKAKGFTVDDFFRGVYRPAGVADNGANSFLSLTGSRNSQRFSVAGGTLSGSGTYNGTFITSTAGFLSWSDSFSGAKVKPAPTLTTPSITITVKIKTFGDVAGCNVTLQGALGIRPDQP